MENQDEIPPWVTTLLKESFFSQCKEHEDSNKKLTQCNFFCIDCVNGVLCRACVSHHKDHRIVQIRRASHRDAVKVVDISEYMNISAVQTYIINNAEIVFLNERLGPKPGKEVSKVCEVCERRILNSKFCSLACKVLGTAKSFPEKNKRHRSSERKRTAGGGARRSQSISPTAPSPTFVKETAKRRKGVHQRAPLQ